MAPPNPLSSQSPDQNPGSEQPASDPPRSSGPPPSQSQLQNLPVSQSQSAAKQDDDYVDIEHEDVEMHDPASHSLSKDDLELHRLDANSADHDDDDVDDDSEEEHESMASHPLLSMLTGRLGQRRRGSTHKWDSLHPVTQVLSVSNVEDCTELEASAFPENERCSREKFEYRLARCPELSLGIFSRPTEAEAKALEGPPKRKLIAHVIATRTPAPSVTDASMALPSNWRQRNSSLPGPDEKELQGHQETGGTICLHSLAVAKEHQGIGLGSVLLKSYIQRIKDSKCADRVALLAHDHLIGFYTNFGFQDMGPSNATFGGGNWNNLVMEFNHDDEED